jgi:putative FmdB family regulatory protein
MPTYEYQCMLCSYRFDLFQSITEEPVRECPKCHGKVERLISAGAGFLFKGKGFYITDYRSEEYRRQKKAEKENKEAKK